MGIAVPCGVHVGMRSDKDNTCRKIMFPRRATLARKTPSSDNPQTGGSRDGPQVLSAANRSKRAESTKELATLLTAVIVQPPSSTAVKLSSPSNGSSSCSARRFSQTSNADHHSGRSGRSVSYSRYNSSSAPPYSGPAHSNSCRMDVTPMNDTLSFSLPEIHSQPSSSSYTERASVNTETYSFGFRTSTEVEQHLYDMGSYHLGNYDMDGRASPPAGEFFEAMLPKRAATAPRQSPPAGEFFEAMLSRRTATTPPQSPQPLQSPPNTDFMAWDMGLGIISGTRCVSPSGSPSAVETKASPTKAGGGGGTAAREPVDVAKDGDSAVSSADYESITGSQLTKRPAEATAKPRQHHMWKKPKKLNCGKSTSTHWLLPSTSRLPTPPTTVVPVTGTTTTTPQQRQISSVVHFKRAFPITTMAATTMTPTTTPIQASAHSSALASNPHREPLKTDSLTLRSQKCGVVSSGPSSQVEQYDLPFVFPAVSRVATKKKTDVAKTSQSPADVELRTTTAITAAAAASAFPATKVAQSRKQQQQQSPKKKGTRRTGASATSAAPPAAEHAEDVAETHVCDKDHVMSDGNADFRWCGMPPDKRSGTSTSPEAVRKRADFPELDVGLFNGRQHNESRVNERYGEFAEESLSFSPKKQGDSINVREAGTARSSATATSAASSSATAALHRSKSTPIYSDSPFSLELLPFEKDLLHKNVHSPRHRMEDGSSDTCHKDPSYAHNKAKDGSGLDQSMESMPSLNENHRVSSILVKHSSFKSRSNSVGPADITPATGSVSFLLGKKEAELAMASSQLLSKAVPLREKERLRRLSEEFGIGVLGGAECGAQTTKASETT